ncbi:V-type ATP synthase subunit I [Bacteroidota bacterium]
MKELFLFISASKTDDALQKLGEMGVVEIRNIKSSEGEAINRTREKIARIEKAINAVESIAGNKVVEIPGWKKYQAVDPERIVDTVLSTGDYRQKIQLILTNLYDQQRWYEIWGTQVSLKDIEFLKNNGIYLHLYFMDKKSLKAFAENKKIYSLPEVNGICPVAYISRDADDVLDLKEEKMPELSLDEVRKTIVKKERQLQEIDLYLADTVEHLLVLKDYLDDQKDSLKFNNALYGMGEIEGAVTYLKGYVPVDKSEEVKSAAAEFNWGYVIQEPEIPEEAPTLVKNPKWISIINPVLEFVGVVPGYKEIDISLFFLMAFSLFFAMLIGDAGYGAVFLLFGILLGKKLPSQFRLLIYVLSGGTIIWGALTGTYFGIESMAKIPFFSNLIIPEIASFGADNIQFMMHLSFVIGAIHLTLAHMLRFFQFINSTKAISELGWVSFVWGIFLVVEMLVLGKEMPGWGQYLFFVGLALVALFSKEDPKLVKSMLLSIANLPLSLINGFSDVVSYVRLFAVGMATTVVAASFNEMILPAGADITVLKMITASIALLLGHGLNIILAIMAVMVHGIRLNMLEFAGHLGIEFSGEEYNPFKLKTKIYN